MRIGIFEITSMAYDDGDTLLSATAKHDGADYEISMMCVAGDCVPAVISMLGEAIVRWHDEHGVELK